MSKEDKKKDAPVQPHPERAAEPNHGDPAEVKLKDPGLAAFLAWLLPGLGHFYQGRFAKGVLFFVCIMGIFTYGLYLGSGPDVGTARVVYWSWKPQDKRLYYFCQVGVGLPAMPALVQSFRVKNGHKPFGTFMAPPRIEGEKDPDPSRTTLSQLYRHLGRYFELGTIFTSIAGLLNILAIFDAFAGPVTPHRKKEREEEEEEGDEEGKEAPKDEQKDRESTGQEIKPKEATDEKVTS